MPTPDNDTAKKSGDQEAPLTSPDTTSQDTAVATDAAADPNISGQEEVFDTQAVYRRIDELTSQLQSNDDEARGKAEKELADIEADLKRREAGGDAPVATAKPEPDTAKKPEEKGAVKDGAEGDTPKFFVTFHGKRVERDDKNKLLGHENTGALKAAYVKRDLQYEDLRKRHDDEVAELNRKLREAETKLSGGATATPTPKPQPSLAPPPPTSRPPLRAPEKPVFPEPPKLSTTDPVDYTAEDRQKLDTYSRQQYEASKKMTQYIDYIEKKPGSLPEEVQSELTELRQWREKAQGVLQKVESNEATRAQQDSEKAHWGRFAGFQAKHKTFETPKPLQDLHGPIVGWMRNVASANGIEAPAGERNDADPEWKTYLANRADLIEKYLSGDAEAVSNAEGFKPPEGHEQYFKLLEVNNALIQYIGDGVFGESATLEDAYDRMLRESGEFGDRVEALRIEERTAGAKRMGDAIEEFSQSASTIPPEASASAPDDSALGIPKEDLLWFRNVGPTRYHELVQRTGRGDASAKASLDKYNAIVARLEAAR